MENGVKFIRVKIYTIKIILLLTMWILCFFPVLTEMIRVWLSHSNNSHGLLVPFISAYFIWQNRDKIKKTEFNESKLGIIILLVSMLIFIIGYIGRIEIVCRMMLVTSLISIIIICYGKKLFTVIRFPLLFLFFMVPVPDSIYLAIAFPLQLFATNVSAFVIKTLSIPVYQEGNLLFFTKTQLEVAEACSGLRSMTSFIMLGFLFSYMINKNYWRKFIIILLAIPLSIFANIIRVTGTGILAHFFGSNVAKGFLHDFSGFAVFGFGFILMLMMFQLINK